MATYRFICSACGERLSPLVKSCPRCGTVREPAKIDGPLMLPGAATAPAFEKSQPEGEAGSEQTQTSPPVVFPLRRPPISRSEVPLYPPPNLVYISPEDEQRRFPILTRYQLMLIAIGLGLIIFGLVIGYLLWRQQKREASRLAAKRAALVQPSPSPPPTPEVDPIPAPPNDQAIEQSVRLALAAYNPQWMTRYKFDVKRGVVNLSGEAENQPEKDGVESVIKPIVGVKCILNNLAVRPNPLVLQVNLNNAEAKQLEEALRKQLLNDQQREEEVRRKQAQVEAEIQAAQQRREQAAAKQREEEAAMRKAAEERLQRLAAEYERQQEEQRRAEAERRTRAEQARLETNLLRSGTVAWSGIVDGTDEIVFNGSSASVRHLGGEPIREARASFSAPMPHAPVSVKLLSANGRGSISIVQEPAATNGYTTIVRVDDSSKGGNKRYEFTLRWSMQ